MHHTSLFMEKVGKALFKIRKCVEFDNPCSLLEKKMFDTLVYPILCKAVSFGMRI